MNIAEIIAAITGGQNPNDAIMNAQGALPPGGSPQAAAPPGPPPGAPQGIPTPVTNPIPDGKAPQAYQSPPDLSNMYLELMRKSQNAAALDGAVNMAAAAFSKYPENRASLLRGVGAGSGAGGITSSDLINLQKQDQANRDSLVLQQALPSLIKQYKFTPAQIESLRVTGQLGDVLKTYSTEQLGKVEDKATGQHILFNQRTGKQVGTLGGEAPEEGVYEDTPQGRKLVSKRIPDDGKTEPLGVVPTEAIKTADAMLARVNAQRPPDKQMTMDEYLKILHPGQSTTVTVGKENFPHVKPETGQDYVRNPDGTIKYDAEGKPTLYNIKGGDPALKAEVAAKEQVEKEKKDRIAKAQTAFTSSNVGQAVRKAFDVVDKPGATGFLSKPARSLGIGGTPADDMDAALNTINANTAFEQLKQMRAGSASGASGLGQVTDTEQQMLKSVIDDLRPYQSTGRVKEGLARVEAAMTLLAGDSFEKGTDLAGFNKQLSELTQEILAREHNKKSGAGGSKVRVVPR